MINWTTKSREISSVWKTMEIFLSRLQWNFSLFFVFGIVKGISEPLLIKRCLFLAISRLWKNSCTFESFFRAFCDKDNWKLKICFKLREKCAKFWAKLDFKFRSFVCNFCASAISNAIEIYLIIKEICVLNFATLNSPEKERKFNPIILILISLDKTRIISSHLKRADDSSLP